MNQFNPFVGQPIRSVQTFLRRIAYADPEVPLVIPDGKYGEQTANAVSAFQAKFNLVVTGEVDNETWDEILAVYDEIMGYEEEPKAAVLYPGAQHVIFPQEENIHLYVIQGMMIALGKSYSGLGSLEKANGIHDEETIEATKNLQGVFGMKQNGVIEKEFWNYLVGFYEACIAKKML